MKYSKTKLENLSKEQIIEIAERGFSILENTKTIDKVTFETGDGSWFKFMPLITNEVIFNKYVTRENGPTHSAYVVSDPKTGEIIDTFSDDNINIYRTAIVAAYSVFRFGPNTINSVSVIGANGRIAKIIQILLKDYLADKKVYKIYRDSSKRELDLALESDLVISATSFIEKPWATSDQVKKNMLVLPVHTRGWHDGVDGAFDEVLTDNFSQVKDWIREDAIEVNNYGPKKVSNAIIYNYGHVAFDFALYEFLKKK